MVFAEMDFSLEGGFQEQLLNRIKAECFAELGDETLDFVNAAGQQQSRMDILDPLKQD